MEAILSLALLSLLVTTGWTILARHRQTGADLADRAERLETVRTIAWLLREEVAGGRPGLDWRIEGSDSLTLRAFRGVALVETGSGMGRTLRVCFRGVRAPEPEKDSVLLLGVDGRWRVRKLEGRVSLSSGCPGVDDGREEEWTLEQGGSGAVLGRLFERGSYHFSGGALRYRRGEGGRQPLTTESVRTGAFFDATESGRPFAWEVTLRGPEGRVGAPSQTQTRVWRGGGW